MTTVFHDDERIVGWVFDAPITVKGLSWFPANEIIVWAVMSWSAWKQHPFWSLKKILVSGALNMSIILGSEWLHNLAHTAAACWIGKPVDAVRVFMGMPLLIYREESTLSVTPTQHIQRGLGGPVLNAGLFVLAAVLRRFTRPVSIARAAADAAVGMNAFLSTLSLLPIPGIDGGSVFKWAAVWRGKTPTEADALVVRANRITAPGLGLAAGLALNRRQWLMGAIFSFFATLSLAIGLGILKEKNRLNSAID